MALKKRMNIVDVPLDICCSDCHFVWRRLRGSKFTIILYLCRDHKTLEASGSLFKTESSCVEVV